MIYLQISDALNIEADSLLGRLSEEETSFLQRAAAEALNLASDVPQADLTLVLADDAQLQDLNHQFLGVDAPTDVLSFPAGETDVDSESLYLGDVIISYPRAQEKAAAGGHSVKDELQLLVVHGVLHLLGFDHGNRDERAVMWAKQAEVLSSLGSSVTAPPQ